MVEIFFLCKKLYCFHLVGCSGGGSRVAQKLRHGCRERLRQEPWHQGDARRASQRVSLWKRHPPSPAWGPPACGASQLVAIFLLSFGARMGRGSPGLTALAGCAGRTGAGRPRRASFRFFSRTAQLPRDGRPGGGPGCRVLASTRRAGHPCASPRPIWGGSGPRLPEPRQPGRNRRPERGRCRRPAGARTRQLTGGATSAE